MQPIEHINAAIYGLKVHAKKHGVPACVKINLQYVRGCEKPFPMQGNFAKDKLDWLRVWAAGSGWKLTEYDDGIDDTRTLTLENANF